MLTGLNIQQTLRILQRQQDFSLYKLRIMPQIELATELVDVKISGNVSAANTAYGT